MPEYSNARAMRALIKASLQSIVKSPSAIIFSIAFPLIFILVFGFLGNSGANFRISVAPAVGADTSNPLFQDLLHLPQLRWKYADSPTQLEQWLAEGEISATISIRQQPQGYIPENFVLLHSTTARLPDLEQLRTIINSTVQQQDPLIRQRMAELTAVDISVSQTREYKMIDFILPGQLGFSLLAAGVFGTAFVFFNMRETLVLKRFFATPVRREVIVLSEGFARLIFQLIGAVIIISIGYYAFGFTLIHGWITFLQMLFLCALGMMVFMGFGFVVSSLAKSEATIPPFSNIITLPQFLLAGTFFPIDEFPSWLQPICRILPLTYLNDALRKISFEGASLTDVSFDIAILLLWGIFIYALAGKLFKWE